MMGNRTPAQIAEMQDIIDTIRTFIENREYVPPQTGGQKRRTRKSKKTKKSKKSRRRRYRK